MSKQIIFYFSNSTDYSKNLWINDLLRRKMEFLKGLHRVVSGVKDVFSVKFDQQSGMVVME